MNYSKARYNQLERLAIETISPLGSYSKKALTAIMMIIAHESLKGALREQVISFDADKDLAYKLSGKDYARGITGQEEFTHNSLWVNSDNIERDYQIVFGQPVFTDDCFINRCTYDDKYAIFMARKKLHMISEPFPEDEREIAAYLSKYYNAGGKGSADDYYYDWVSWNEE